MASSPDDQPALDWGALERLRAAYLGGDTSADYWRSEDDLRAYDRTFGQRIAWKWDAVLADLASLGIAPPAGATVLDFGCGTGVASRRLHAHFPTVGAVQLHDRSPLARGFAAARLQEQQPRLQVASWDGAALPRPSVLLASHVLGELPPRGEATLLDLARQADLALFVEPGTHHHSRRLLRLREALRSELTVIAPCPHGGPCGLLESTRARDWCHHFAPPDGIVFHDRGWAELGRRLGIDLRSLPVAHLVLGRGPPPALPPGRLIGRARLEKGSARLLVCRAEGVTELRLLKRHHPDIHRRLATFELALRLDDR